MTGLLRVDRHSPEVAVLTLDRPERRNALSVALRDEISDRLDDLAGDTDLKVLVITGEGSVFSSGDRKSTRLNSIHRRLSRMPSSA